MNLIFLAATSGGILESAQQTGLQFGFDKWMFTSQCISFIIVCFLLNRFAYKPILAVLEERRERIAEGLANAEKIKQQLAEAEQIIVKAREAAEAEHAQMLVELKREVGRLVINTTTKVTGKILTPEDQKRISEETAVQVAA